MSHIGRKPFSRRAAVPLVKMEQDGLFRSQTTVQLRHGAFMDTQQYVSIARLILGFLGQEKENTYGFGRVISRARVFEDDKIRLIEEQDSLMLEIEKKENTNPVIWITEKGELLRTHGERIHLKDHMLSLAKRCLNIFGNEKPMGTS